MTYWTFFVVFQMTKTIIVIIEQIGKRSREFSKLVRLLILSEMNN